MSTPPPPDRWKIEGRGIVWDVANDTRLPHSDHVEMSGRKVSVIVRYGVDENRNLTLSREVIWPTLRTKPGDVRGYLKRTYGNEKTPKFFLLMPSGEEKPIHLKVASIRFDGTLVITYERVRDYVPTSFQQAIFPSTLTSMICEEWKIEPLTASDIRVHFRIDSQSTEEKAQGVYGEYIIKTYAAMPPDIVAIHSFPVVISQYYQASRADQPAHKANMTREWFRRDNQSQRLLTSANQVSPEQPPLLHLETSDKILNTAFAFAKLRAAESIFETAMGLVHSPGGGRYYGGIWANDQAEYSGPLFGYLGDETAKEAALNAYRRFAAYMKPGDYSPMPTSLEMEGTIEIHAGGDRGDAAMYASGASRFALATGDRAIAEELYPAVAWCLEYCRRKTNENGVVESDTDELEGRFPTGDANLSTSSLAYDGLRRGADLARALRKDADAAEYDRRADALHAAIETHFGATVEGYDTYRYYDGNTKLRSWICLPLTVGIMDRAKGTIDALLSPQLWTPDGLATESGGTVFWDRATLYALRGLFAAGEPEIAREKFSAYLRRRLLGDHVPYAVEAHPEGGQAHLSAESALLCRVVTEGMLGIVPTGLRSFRLTVNLPSALRFLDCHVNAFGQSFKIAVRNFGDGNRRVSVAGSGGSFLDETGPNGATYTVILPK